MNAQLQVSAADSVPSRWRGTRVTLAHGAGGRAMRELISEVIAPMFANSLLAPLEDQARIPLLPWVADSALAFTTDSYVVSPLKFAGGDIGRLAVCGTVNDLAVGGARPQWLSCGLILEEGLAFDTLIEVLSSMRDAAREAGVSIVTGDTKVVERGAADGMFINTAGIGVIAHGRNTGAANVRAGDKILINGTLGDHGIAVMAARNDLALQIPVRSDAAPLNGLVEAMFAAAPALRWMRDCTRGGLATVANEFAAEGGFSVHLDETALPVADAVRGACEILGLDPLYLANEGKLAAIVPADQCDALLAAMHAHPFGHRAAVVGEIGIQRKRLVVLRSRFGGERVVDLLQGDQLPRIC
jgi:hydrogenase expression/formation protein HypE